MRRHLRLEELDARLVPTFYGNQLFPLDNPWNQVISAAPVAANSDAIINHIVSLHSGTAPKLHADFGNPTTDGALYGIPVNIATNSTPKYTITIPGAGYASESDQVQVPIPANAVLEGDGPTGPAPPGSRGDSHLIVYDRDANKLYELVSAARPSETSYPYGGTKPTGVWGAYQVSYWDLNTNYFRTVGATSADAAGLPILTGLVRPDEANPPSAGGVGVIDHAIRMTVQQTRNMFVYPASHLASSRTGTDLPRMGERFRLKASFVIPSTWSPEAKAIAQAMKTYGMIVADNGSDMYFTGMPSSTWNMGSVLQVQSIKATDFEVVDLAPRVTGLNVNTGSTAGGTSVTISGYNFGGAAGQLHVLFGTVEATSVTVLSDSQVVAVSPVHAAGTVDIRVQSGTTKTDIDGGSVFFGYGTSAAVAADQFTFSTGSSGGPPTANADSYSILHDKTLAVAAAGVLANDTSNPAGHTLTAALVTGPVHGSVTLNANGSFTYTPATGYAGSDTFTYTAADGALVSTSATVTLTVTNQAPTAANNSYTTGKDTPLNISAPGVLGNDSDADGDVLAAILGSGPANGTLSLNANGSFTYTPNAGFAGSDSFTYRANDKAASSSPATVTITVTSAPTANPDSYSVVHDRVLNVSASGVLANDTSNPAGHTLTAQLATGPAHGTVTLNSNGSFSYTPSAGYTGSDSFTYSAVDGGLTSSPATVSLNVTNQAPVAAGDSYKTAKGQMLTVPAAGVLNNDTDANGDPLTAILAAGPANGTLSLNTNGSFTYTPNAGFAGTDSFTYKANDGAADSSAATVNIAVSAAPRVESVVINDGSAQRSIIRSITITFDTLVTFDTGAFSLVRTSGGTPSRVATITQVNGKTQVVFSNFGGSGAIYGSLADGSWTLKVLAARVHRADDRSVTMAADSVTSFHRYFGDSDGDRDVDAADQTAFNAAFGHTDAASLATFDFDHDGDVDAADRNRFNKRFGHSI